MNFNQLYSAEVLKHFRHPKNMGEIKNPDGVATVGNLRCGDIMRLYIKVGKRPASSKSAARQEKYLKDIKFQTLGCAAAVASSSMLTMMMKGKPLSAAEKISRKAIAEALGGLPPQKIHCSVLAGDALKKAIENYRLKR